jgi:hypothetical protein
MRVRHLVWMVVPSLASCGLLGALSPPKETLTTSYKKPLGDSLPPDAVPFKDPKPLDQQPRLPTGEFVLAPGSYEMELPSFCLHAGKGGGGKGTAYLAAKLEGPKAALIEKLIQRADERAGVTQQELQTLIWAVLARAKLNPKHPGLGPAIRILLSDDEVKQVNDDRLEVFSGKVLEELKKRLPQEARDALEAENRLRGQFDDANTSFAELEATAVPSLGDEGPALGTWTRTPDGYLIRFFPQGYSRTRVQIHVEPKKAAFGIPPAGGGWAVPLGTPGVRAQGSPWGDSPGSQCQIASLKGMVAAPNDARRQRLLTAPPTNDDVKGLRNAKTDKQIEKALGDVAKKCEDRVNEREGYGATNPPQGRECTRLGTLKHECAEEMIVQSGNPRIHSEVAYGQDTKVLPPRGTPAGTQCRADVYDRMAKQGAQGGYGHAAAADCGGYMCADVVVLKQGKTTPAKSNVAKVYDFKFPCPGTEPDISFDQLDKYEHVFGKYPGVISP